MSARGLPVLGGWAVSRGGGGGQRTCSTPPTPRAEDHLTQFSGIEPQEWAAAGLGLLGAGIGKERQLTLGGLSSEALGS